MKLRKPFTILISAISDSSESRLFAIAIAISLGDFLKILDNVWQGRVISPCVLSVELPSEFNHWFSFNPTSFNLIALQFPQIIPQIAIGERNYFNIKTLYDEGNYSSIAEIFVQSFQMLFNNYTYGFHTDMPFTYPHNEHFLYVSLKPMNQGITFRQFKIDYEENKC